MTAVVEKGGLVAATSGTAPLRDGLPAESSTAGDAVRLGDPTDEQPALEGPGGSRPAEDDRLVQDTEPAAPPPLDHRAEFEAFMVASGPALGRLALFLAGDTHRAEELLQQTFVRMWSAWPRVRDGEPHAYARRVMANQRIDTWRLRRRETLTAPDALPEDTVAEGDGQVADRDQLVRALRALPERRRRVVVLRYLVGLSEAETARTVGVTAGTVKSTAARGLAQLRTVLERQEEGS